MTEKEAKKCFEQVHSAKELMDMQKDIDDIDTILSQNPISIELVQVEIRKINTKHPENIILNHIIFPPHNSFFNRGYILDQNLIDDLTWKRIYLQAKKTGKLFDNLCKEMRKV